MLHLHVCSWKPAIRVQRHSFHKAPRESSALTELRGVLALAQTTRDARPSREHSLTYLPVEVTPHNDDIKTCFVCCYFCDPTSRRRYSPGCLLRSFHICHSNGAVSPHGTSGFIIQCVFCFFFALRDEKRFRNVLEHLFQRGKKIILSKS